MRAFATKLRVSFLFSKRNHNNLKSNVNGKRQEEKMITRCCLLKYGRNKIFTLVEDLLVTNDISSFWAS